MNGLQMIVQYWPFLVALAAAIFVGGYGLYTFIKYPTSKKKQKIANWLLYAVTEAEKQFGGGTGAIKLRYVYDQFLGRFPAVASVISFETFSKMVDDALVQMRKILETNSKVKDYVEDSNTVSIETKKEG